MFEWNKKEAPLKGLSGMGGGVGRGSSGGLGSSAGNAATSAKAILADDPSASSGAYWISVQGVATELYCDMTTDGGGFMLCGKYNATGGNNTNSNGVSNLNNLTASSNATYKLSDADIKSLAATSSQYEWSLRVPSGSSPTTIYIMRYSSSNWNNWASNGATNMAYESKASNGTWVSGFNGHFNNRGFSTYSDNHGDSCTTVFSGTKVYRNSYHTSGGTTGDFFLWIR